MNLVLRMLQADPIKLKSSEFSAKNVRLIPSNLNPDSPLTMKRKNPQLSSGKVQTTVVCGKQDENHSSWSSCKSTRCLCQKRSRLIWWNLFKEMLDKFHIDQTKYKSWCLNLLVLALTFSLFHYVRPNSHMFVSLLPPSFMSKTRNYVQILACSKVKQCFLIIMSSNTYTPRSWHLDKSFLVEIYESIRITLTSQLKFRNVFLNNKQHLIHLSFFINCFFLIYNNIKEQQT